MPQHLASLGAIKLIMDFFFVKRDDGIVIFVIDLFSLYENEWPRILLLSQFLLKNVVRVENDNNRGCKCQENKICQTYNAWFFGQTVPLGSAHIWITPSP